MRVISGPRDGPLPDAVIKPDAALAQQLAGTGWSPGLCSLAAGL